MPRILPVPDPLVYEYVVEPDKNKRSIGQQYQHRVLRKREVPLEPPEDGEGG